MQMKSLKHKETLKSRWPAWASAASLALVLVSAGCGRGGARAAANGSSQTPSPRVEFVLPANPRGVALAEVRAEPLADYLDVPARIQADPTRVVRVYAPVSGRLIAVEVRPADLVKQGQALAIVASSDVATARQAYQQALADDTLKRQALARSKLLRDHHAIAEKDYEQAEADARMSAAALESAIERLNLLNVGLDGSSDRIVVKSPQSGVVIALSAAAGEFSKSLDNSDPLCTIADLTSVWAVGAVYEKDLATVHVGAPAEVTLDAYPGEHWRGRVTAIAGVVDPTTRTLNIRVVLANPGLRLKPDMYASLRLVRSVHRAVVVPSEAVVREGNANYVFREQAPGRFIRRAVSIGPLTTRGEVEIASGLSAGDTIVVEGAELLRPGS